MSLDKELADVRLKLVGWAEDQVASTLFAITGRTIKETPVDQGRLRNNWQSSIGRPIKSEINGNDPSGGRAISEAIAVIKKMELGDTFYFTNNLPYAARIEYKGHSDLAPKGMLRINVERVVASLRRQ